MSAQRSALSLFARVSLVVTATLWFAFLQSSEAQWQDKGATVELTTSTDRVGVGVSPSSTVKLQSKQTSTSSGATAVQGDASATSGATRGVAGTSASSSGIGVKGDATAGSGTTVGVAGTSKSTSGTGVTGAATATSGSTKGAMGTSASSSGIGVYGVASSTSSSSTGIGVKGYSSGGQGIGVSGVAAASVTGTTGYGVKGVTDHDTASVGVYGIATSTRGQAAGVRGESSSNEGAGVYGYALSMTGATAGVYGESVSPSGCGVYGEAPGGGYGVYGEAPSWGVKGVATNTSGSAAGVKGECASPNGAGVYGESTATTGWSAGVLGVSESRTGVYGSSWEAAGVLGHSLDGNGVEGQSDGAGVGVRALNTGGGVIMDGYSSSSDREMALTNGGNLLLDGTVGGPADFAELLGVQGQEGEYEYGDVMALTADGKLKLADSAYDSAVVGVFSKKAGFLGDYVKLDDDGTMTDKQYEERAKAEGPRVPVALIGVVYVKVCNENGEIVPGDLLTTSSTPGHAMKCTDKVKGMGAILGKALQPLPGEKGRIRVLVMQK